jgi:heme exporter protein D
MGVYGFWVGLVIAALLASTMMLVRWNLVSKREIANWSATTNQADN